MVVQQNRRASGPLLLILALTVFYSCSTRLSVEKRNFRPGYHVELSRTTGKAPARHSENITSAFPTEDTQIQADREPHGCEMPNSLEHTASEQGTDAVASIDLPDTLGHDVSLLARPPATMRLYGLSNALQADKDWLRDMQRVNSVSFQSAPEAKGNQGLKVAGIVLVSVGFLLFLFISWLIGLIIMLLGLGLLIAGLNKPSNVGSSSQRKDEPTWQDVVYLKNGSVIKGLIIEQVPNESLKIQTADGSIFVYEMNQVAKIAKEQK
jgi:hypothetical protein